jgi:hypothetical protein
VNEEAIAHWGGGAVAPNKKKNASGGLFKMKSITMDGNVNIGDMVDKSRGLIFCFT